MKKLYSLMKASMTSGMNLFKIKGKKSGSFVPIFIALYLMFVIWGTSNTYFERLAPLHLQYILIPLCVFGISIMTIIEGIYKSGSLIFNAKDDDLLLSLPIKKSTIFFIRVFKFYVFELLFNSLFIIPVMISYIRWAEYLDWTYYLSSIIMIFLLPIIPIVLSCIIGIIISSLSSRFKYKNFANIVISMFFLVLVLYISFNMDNFMNYLISHANSINDLITNIYYPAGIYGKLITNFNLVDLIKFIFINLFIFGISIFILSKFYFRINSRIKKVTISRSVNINKLTIRKNNKYISLIKKELNTFFKTPVFIINAGFGLLLFIIATVVIAIKFNSFLPMLTGEEGLNLSKDFIMNHISIFILFLIIITSFMTSITNSVISLEGRNINILKSLPINVKTILLSKIYSSLVLTTPVLFIGNIILFIRFKVSIIESILLLIISILLPLISHFIGIIVNLKYPKLDFESATEVVKQSTSSLVAVMIGMLLIVINIAIIISIMSFINSILLLIMVIVLYSFINLLLYIYLINNGVKNFKDLSI